MPFRIGLALIGVVAAAVIPMSAFRLGVPVFWSQALGIVIGSLPMYMAFAPRPPNVPKIVLPWATAMTVATLIVLAIHRVFG